MTPELRELLSNLGSLVVTFIGIPWCIWVTTSIFNQRQEIALLKQILSVVMNKKE